MKHFAQALCVWLLAGNAAAAGFEAREISFQSEQYRLPGTLTSPSRAPAFASVLIIPGSGPVDRNGNSRFAPAAPPVYRQWAERLSAAGLMVLRYDKRFLADPKIDVLSIDLDVQIADALSAVAYLRSLPGPAAQRIFIVGHSEGGTLAPLVAERGGASAGVAVINSVVFAVDELVVAQLEARPGFPKNDLDEVKRRFAQIADGSFSQRGILLGGGSRYWTQWIGYSRGAPETLSRLPVPVLLVQCLGDESLPGTTLARNVAALRSAAAAGKQIELREFPGLDHFGLAPGAKKASPQLLRALIEWMKRQAS
jgi:uncharacterized protein